MDDAYVDIHRWDSGQHIIPIRTSGSSGDYRVSVFRGQEQTDDYPDSGYDNKTVKRKEDIPPEKNIGKFTRVGWARLNELEDWCKGTVTLLNIFPNPMSSLTWTGKIVRIHLVRID